MTRVEQAMRSTACRAFEEMGMILPAEDPAVGDTADDHGSVAVAVEYRGVGTGVFAMRLDRPLAAQFAANMIGRDAPPADPEIMDAVKELANVICGNLLPLIARGDGRFQLTAPRTMSDADYARTRTSPHVCASVAQVMDSGRWDAVLWSADRDAWLKEDDGDTGTGRR